MSFQSILYVLCTQEKIAKITFREIIVFPDITFFYPGTWNVRGTSTTPGTPINIEILIFRDKASMEIDKFENEKSGASKSPKISKNKYLCSVQPFWHPAGFETFRYLSFVLNPFSIYGFTNQSRYGFHRNPFLVQIWPILTLVCKYGPKKVVFFNQKSIKFWLKNTTFFCTYLHSLRRPIYEHQEVIFRFFFVPTK